LLDIQVTVNLLLDIKVTMNLLFHWKLCNFTPDQHVNNPSYSFPFDKYLMQTLVQSDLCFSLSNKLTRTGTYRMF
jgi:hypothetical protein